MSGGGECAIWIWIIVFLNRTNPRTGNAVLNQPGLYKWNVVIVGNMMFE